MDNAYLVIVIVIKAGKDNIVQIKHIFLVLIIAQIMEIVQMVLVNVNKDGVDMIVQSNHVLKIVVIMANV